MSHRRSPVSRRVGLLVDTDDTWGQRVVAAICEYARSQQWTLLISPRDEEGRFRLPSVWQGHGVIASLRHPSLIRHTKRRGLPTVDVSGMTSAQPWLARVATDDQQRAQLVLEHLLERGIRHFAYYGPVLPRYTHVRAQAFEQVVAEAGYTCSIYPADRERPGSWLSNYSGVRRWLSRLPRPLGVFAADPWPARQLVEICVTDDIRIPDEVAVISGDDDELLCSLASPQISAVELASQQIGHQAAELLHKLMDGATPPQEVQLLPPVRIQPRQSTDLQSVDDPQLSQILQYMRDHAGQGLTVADVLQRFPVSRRSLEQRFRQALHRSPGEELRRIRMDHICRLLRETDQSLQMIARASGFSTAAGLCEAFRRRFGQTPGEYRNR